MSAESSFFQVGNGIQAAHAAWSFSGEVTTHFDAHVRQSIPFYDEGHALVCALSDFFVKQDSVCYEIGSSLGTLTQKLAQHHRAKPAVSWIGIDREADMVAQATARNQYQTVQFLCEDCLSVTYEKSDFIVAYYTVQFVPPRHRQALISRLYEALNWGGAFLLFEKVRGADARFQDILTTLYTDFKLQNGYTPDDIIGKTRSLKGILEPFSTQGNLDLLSRAGFVDVMGVMKYLCFEGFLAIK